MDALHTAQGQILAVTLTIHIVCRHARAPILFRTEAQVVTTQALTHQYGRLVVASTPADTMSTAWLTVPLHVLLWKIPPP
jgi:hypothetical protein